MSGLIGRARLLDTAREQLAAGHSLHVHGSPGSGRTSFLAALLGSDPAALRLRPRRSDRMIPYALTADLLALLEERCERLSPPRRRAVEVVLRRRDGTPDPIALRLAVTELLDDVETLAIDDAERIDPASLDLLDHVLAAPRARVRLLTASASRSRFRPIHELTLRPLGPDELAELLGREGLPGRTVGRIHAASAGNPALALEIAYAFRTGDRSIWDPLPIPARTFATLEEVNADTHETLLFAALAREPTVSLLHRCGCDSARADLAHAEVLGIARVGSDGDDVTFLGTTWPDALVEQADPARLRSMHETLATLSDDPIEVQRHRAFASPAPGEALAGDLDAAAALARTRGDRGLAAELGLLAAERSGEPVQAESRLVAASDDAGAAGRADLAWRAARALFRRTTEPTRRVHGRLAVIAASGQGIDGLDEMFAAAMTDAAGDPGLLAEINLRLAVKANLGSGSPRRALAAAEQAAGFAVEAGDSRRHAMALTMCARMERILADSSADETLERALAIDVPETTDDLRDLPRFLAARCALFDDRLDTARAELSALLPLAERSGSAGDRLEIVRGLAEVEARSGRCTRALAHAQQALLVTERAALSPGPAWHTAAVAELAGGSLARAASFAEQGAKASEQESDVVYLPRNLHVAGLTRLLSGDVDAAVERLERVRAIETGQGVVDPSLLRWHGDLATAYVRSGRTDDAENLLAEVRPIAERLGTAGVLATLDRAHGLLLATDPDEALAHLRNATDRFDALGLRLEAGRTLLEIARVERRRRHSTPARSAMAAAYAIFQAAKARPWIELCRAFASDDATHGNLPGLTPAESRIVELVRTGARNHEIAAALFVSVKTVEGTLTRLYRRYGVRSRTQLLSHLGA